MSVSGIFFPNQLLTAQGLGAFGAGALSDGVLDGCGITFSGGNAVIASGFIVCGGRVFGVSGESVAVSGLAVIKCRIDTTGTSTTAAFAQVAISAVSAASDAAAAAIIAGLADSDINLSGTAREGWIAVVDAANGSVKAVNRATAGGVMQTLWENASPTAEFGEQDIILPGAAKYDAFAVTFRRDNEDSEYGNIIQTILCPMDGAASRRFVCNDFGLGDQTYSGKHCLRERWVTITPGSGTVHFAQGYWTGWNNGAWSTSPDGGTLVPLAVHGLCVR